MEKTENDKKFYDVIFAGNYTKDTIITPEGTKEVDGGGMNYAAHAGKQLGIQGAVVTRLSKEDEHVVENLRRDGIVCYPIYSLYSTLMTLEYPTYDVDQRNLYVKHVAESILPQHLEGLDAKAIAVSPSIRGEVSPEFFHDLRQRDNVILAADVQGFVRVLRNETLVYEPWDEMEDILSHLDILKSDAMEAKYLTGETDIEKAALFYVQKGVKEVVLTHANGVLIHAEGQNHHFEFHSSSMSGRSGRGDTCLGAYVSMRLSKPPREAGIWTAAVTSLKVEKHGVFDRPIQDVEEFISKYYR